MERNNTSDEPKKEMPPPLGLSLLKEEQMWSLFIFPKRQVRV
jgi:hypothetical protein